MVLVASLLGSMVLSDVSTAAGSACASASLKTRRNWGVLLLGTETDGAALCRS